MLGIRCRYCSRAVKRLTALLAVVFIVLHIVACSSEAVSVYSKQLACKALRGKGIASTKIGLPTSGALLQTVEFVSKEDSSEVGAEYCAVKGIIVPVDPEAPNMEFQVNLPSDWNRRVLQLGGGGNNGVLITGLDPYRGQSKETPHVIADGYVTLGSDGGHQGAHIFDFSYALNEESFLNYVHHSIKKTRDVAVAVTELYYGWKPGRFYFIGISKGGHEALAAATHYPESYDGVISISPAYNMALLFWDFLHFGQSIYANDNAGWINNTKRELLTESVYKACDSLDNLEDGLIANVEACNQVFSIETVKSDLRCKDGKDTGDDCFSDGQIQFLETKSSPNDIGFPVGDQQVVSGWPLLEGSDFLLQEWLTGFGYSPRFLPKHVPVYLVGSGFMKYFVTKDLDLDTLNFDPEEYKKELQSVAQITDVTSLSLKPFKDKGGKVLLIHGALDSNISHRNTVDYYKRQVDTLGQETVDEFLRFYIVPGYDHGFGRYDLGFDGIGSLVDWVENGSAPEVIESIDNNSDVEQVPRVRPMCPWPAYPKFIGAPGAGEYMKNFACVEEQSSIL